MKKLIFGVISTFLSMLFLCSPAAAITPDYDNTQTTIVCSGTLASCDSYTMSPGDTVQYGVKLELPDGAALVCISPHSALNFVSGGELEVDNDSGETFFTKTLGYTTTDGYFYDLSEMPHGGTGSFTYVLSLTDTPTVGAAGMASEVLVLDKDGNTLSSSESPRVYSLYTSISTVDTRLPKSSTSSSSKGPVVETYNGQYVGEGSFTLYSDKELRHPVSFLQKFRDYTVCPEGTDGATQSLETDVGGHLFVKGLRAGTYYLSETKPPIDYYKATSGPIAITVDLLDNGDGKLEFTKKTPMMVDDDEVVLLREVTSGTDVMLNYKDASASFHRVLLRHPLVLGIAVVVVAVLGGVGYTHLNAPKKEKNS